MDGMGSADGQTGLVQKVGIFGAITVTSKQVHCSAGRILNTFRKCRKFIIKAHHMHIKILRKVLDVAKRTYADTTTAFVSAKFTYKKQ